MWRVGPRMRLAPESHHLVDAVWIDGSLGCRFGIDLHEKGIFS